MTKTTASTKASEIFCCDRYLSIMDIGYQLFSLQQHERLLDHAETIDQRQDRQRRNTRRGLRKHNPPEDPPFGCALQPRRFDGIIRNAANELIH